MNRWHTMIVLLVIFLNAATVAAGVGKKTRDGFVNGVGIPFVFISPGVFTMGSPPDEPGRHRDEVRQRVEITKGFYMGVTEVTQGQWQTVMGANPAEFKKCGPDCPVETVSWLDTQKFIEKLNALEGTDTYRLPTEAEWEYACRAGTDTAFSFGDCLTSKHANYDASYTQSACPRGKYLKKPTPAAAYPANAWGLHDMHGNVWEWTGDWYGQRAPEPSVDPTGAPSGRYKVIRGGAWEFLGHDCRSANRDRSAPDRSLNHTGFRLVMALPR